MDKERYLIILEQIRHNRKPLILTIFVLIILGILIGLMKGCKNSDPLIEESTLSQKIEGGAEDTDQLVVRIQNCSRLYTTEYQVHKIVTHEDQKELNIAGLKVGIPFTDRHIAIPMDATVKAYIDLGAISEKNVQKKGNQIIVTLPDPHVEITSSVIDHDNTLSHVSFVRSNYSAKEQEALHQQGLNAIAGNILNTDILENAKLSATRTLVPIITRMGYKEEDIRICFSKEKFTTSDLEHLIDGNLLKLNSKKE